MGLKPYVREVMPLTGMVVMEGSAVSLTIMTKTVMAGDLSHFVFVFYSNALASLILLLSSLIFFSHRPKQSCFTPSHLSKFFLLGLAGIAVAQNCAFAGLNYSSPIVVCSMGSLMPAFSFLLTIISRGGETDDIRSSSIKSKSMGTLISIMGALAVTLYKGPAIRRTPASLSPSHDDHQLQLSPHQPLLLFASASQNWVLGAILLAISSFSVSTPNLIQKGIAKEYPETMSVVTFYSFFGTIQCAIVSLIAERDPSAWKLKNKLELVTIVLSALIGGVMRNGLHAWCTHRNGPVYVAMFKPLSIVFAVTVGVILFGDSLHFGSVMGAFVIATGYYCFMWGLIKEEEMSEEYREERDSGSSIHKVPLLEGNNEV